MVIIGWADATNTVQSVTDTAGNTYVLAFPATVGTGLSQAIYYAKNIVASASNTVTVTFSATTANARSMIRIRSSSNSLVRVPGALMWFPQGRSAVPGTNGTIRSDETSRADLDRSEELNPSAPGRQRAGVNRRLRTNL